MYQDDLATSRYLDVPGSGYGQQQQQPGINSFSNDGTISASFSLPQPPPAGPIQPYGDPQQQQQAPHPFSLPLTTNPFGAPLAPAPAPPQAMCQPQQAAGGFNSPGAFGPFFAMTSAGVMVPVMLPGQNQGQQGRVEGEAAGKGKGPKKVRIGLTGTVQQNVLVCACWYGSPMSIRPTRFPPSRTAVIESLMCGRDGEEKHGTQCRVCAPLCLRPAHNQRDGAVLLLSVRLQVFFVTPT